MKKESFSKLNSWFAASSRALPWRDSPTLYRVWISEVMLQQTQVATVLPYFEKFMSRFGTVESLAEASIEEVYELWAGLGYYSRARSLHETARRIASEGFPKTREGWLEMKGVGPYTAGAIVSIALNIPEPILDGNVERVFSRFYTLGRENGDTAFKESLWERAREFVKESHALGYEPRNMNQALMELGAVVCKPKNPQCDVCPIALACLARQGGVQALYPPKRKRAEFRELKEKRVALVNLAGQVLLVQAQAGEWRAGLWDLPEPSALTTLKSSVGQNFKIKSLGTVTTQHVVTNHKITRETEVKRISASEDLGVLDLKTEKYQWINLDQKTIASGSALKKTWSEISELLN